MNPPTAEPTHQINAKKKKEKKEKGNHCKREIDGTVSRQLDKAKRKREKQLEGTTNVRNK